MRLLCLMLWAASAFSFAQAASTKEELFDLKIRLADPFNKDFAVLTTVRTEQPFELTATNGATVNKFSGVLHNPTKGIYPLDLTISEWKSPKQNIRETTKLSLELGKTRSEGTIAGLVYLYSVVLRRHQSDP